MKCNTDLDQTNRVSQGATHKLVKHMVICVVAHKCVPKITTHPPPSYMHVHKSHRTYVSAKNIDYRPTPVKYMYI